jgi:hypothetical protein
MIASLDFMVEVMWSRLQSASTSMKNLYTRNQGLSSCSFHFGHQWLCVNGIVLAVKSTA